MLSARIQRLLSSVFINGLLAGYDQNGSIEFLALLVLV